MRTVTDRPLWWPLWLLLSTLICIGSTQAQVIPLRHYAQDQGLLGLAGTCLLQRRDGSLLVCSESGLYAFDGDQFQQVTLQGRGGHYISDAAEDAERRLWVATFDAIYVDDGAPARWIPLEQNSLPSHRKLNRPRLATPAWGTVVLDDRRLLRAVRKADASGWELRPLFDAATLAQQPELADIHDQFVVDDTLWLGCARALCRIDADGRATRYDQAHGLPPDFWRNAVRDRAGSLWVVGSSKVMRLPAGATRFQEQTPPGLDGPALVTWRTPILLDPQGRVLVRTNHGLARWEDGRWRTFDRRNGLPEGNLVAMRFDQAGDLWLSMDGEGVLRWNGYGWIENWDVSQGISRAPTWSIQRTQHGELLIGNEGGVDRLREDGRFQRWANDNGTQMIGLRRAADGTLWSIGSIGMLRHYDAQGRLLRAYPALRSVGRQRMVIAKQLFVDATDRVWILTDDGVYLLAQATADAVPQRLSTLPGGEYSDIQQRHDGSLLVTGAAGLFRLRGDTWTPIRLVADSAPAQPALSKLLILDDGQAWATLYGPGAWQGRLDGDTLHLAPADAELSGLYIYNLRRTRNGWIWISHNQGVDVYDGRAWSRLTQAQGLLWNDMSESAFLEDHDGSVWLGSSRGVTHLLDPTRLFPARAPRLVLKEFSRGGVPVGAGTRLRWSEDPLHIAVGSPDLYDERNRISFRYRFEGAHTRWLHTPNFEFEQPPLAPGHYVLEVQLLDAYRRSASAPLRVAFSVAPVWWRSQPMLVLYLLLGGGLVVALLLWRERRLHQRQRELADLVARRTEELEHDKRELEIARAALAVKASHDALTGLLNRAGILEALAAQMRRSDAEQTSLAVAMIDLDHFKRINDEHGHLVGDAVLIEVARRLGANLRDADLVGRYGGEELLAVLPGLPTSCGDRLQTLRTIIAGQPLRIGERQLAITASIGVAWYRPGEPLQQLLARADAALYQAKRLGRDRVELQPA
ncbi:MULTISPECIES: ligand-binding sensor domain-containing diguanylate cyclase [Xanthomonas]|uniref:ligand-binding sensor domain-containing diguanylate cyclase n=1 Tax=Xanthomonas TaxID=338 RepID=UPI001FD243AB|nr:MULTISPECIES: ligand-binding sensor domain-containing diguanylate cyclase [unclassified Xanthomonas]WNH43103.1 diguanylate cyclase [Xanthomonas sp. A6251]